MTSTADLYILLKLKDEASKELNKVAGPGGLGGLEKAAIAAGAALAGALAAGLASSIGKAAEFEKQISAIKAVTGATAEEAEQLSKVALQLGKDTAFSALEAAKGIEELTKGGVSVADVMGGAAKSALDLAAAGSVSVGEAAAIAAKAMALFNIEGKDTGDVVNKIAGFANATTGSVGDFGLAMSAGGSAAKLAGQNFDQFATAIAIMGKAGILGSDAGTSLKTMLLNLIPTTARASEMFTTLGLRTAEVDNAFVNADGSFKDLRDIAGELNRVTKDLTEEQRTLALETIFGSDAIRAAALLAEAGAEGFDEMAESMSKVTAEAVAAERLNNLAGVMEQLGGSIETAQIQLGTAFLPVLREAAEALLGFINDAILPFVEENAPAWAEAIKTMTDALKDLKDDPLSGLKTELPETSELFAKLAGTEAIGAVITKLGELKDAYKEAQREQQETDKTTGILTATFPLHVQALEMSAKSLNETAGALDAFGATAQELKTTMVAAWDGITKAIGTAMSDVGTKIKEGWDTAQKAVSDAQDEIKQTVKEVWEGIPEDIRADLGIVVSLIGEKFNEAGTAINTALDQAKNAVSMAFGEMASAIGTKLDEAKHTVETKFREILSEVTKSSEETKTQAIAPWQGLADEIGPHLSGAISAITTWVGNVISELVGLAAQALTQAQTIGTNITEGIKSGIGAGVQSIKDAAGNAARASLAAAKEALGEHSESVEFYEIGYFADLGLAHGIEENADLFYTAVSNLAATGITEFREAMEAEIPPLVLTFEGLLEAITGIAETRAYQERLGKAGFDLMNALDAAITEATPKNIQTVATVADRMLVEIERHFGKGSALGDQLMAAIREAIFNNSPETVRALEDVLERVRIEGQAAAAAAGDAIGGELLARVNKGLNNVTNTLRPIGGGGSSSMGGGAMGGGSGISIGGQPFTGGTRSGGSSNVPGLKMSSGGMRPPNVPGNFVFNPKALGGAGAWEHPNFQQLVVHVNSPIGINDLHKMVDQGIRAGNITSVPRGL